MNPFLLIIIILESLIILFMYFKIRMKNGIEDIYVKWLGDRAELIEKLQEENYELKLWRKEKAI